MTDKVICAVIYLLLGGCSFTIVAARVHCEITGIETDCPRWVH